MEVRYLLDGVDFKNYGVSVSDSMSTIGKLKMKEPFKIDWENYHGDAVDLRKKYYKSRDITLECYIKADSATEFITKFNAFSAAFDKAYTNRLTLLLEGNEPIPFEVYLRDGIDVKKKWSDGLMVGTFTLVLNEPEPVKRVLKYAVTGVADSTLTIVCSSRKMLNIYWGDGSFTFDASGEAQTVSHTYAANGTYYIVITGDIDEITQLITAATTIWSKLS